MLAKAESWILRGLEAVLVILLAGMVVMVFGNVVLRYAFNSGLDLSEELSRYFFVWLTFIGAVVVMRENGHLGVDTLVGALGRQGRLICMIISDAFILACSLMLLDGTWKQHEINATAVAPVTGLSMGYVYGVLYFAGIGIGFITLARLVRALTGKLGEFELAEFAGDYSGNPSHDLKGHLE
ncbi:TRAP transporter small permease [Bosea sp. BIWAKO-01]|uniref:TRAP transporter small permease n=1 Tax=Bosea sp. BIWAKO-01 TaxID=506668 RepID=UPI00085372E0|nr:TRAP transporter small permease [Bosea sp. BIWAKO-01]GAU81747.1 TRAP-type C4-dicarboxylate transport system small permease component [Bosea sp. BIWAKO-01]